jgi:hypothetical protein
MAEVSGEGLQLDATPTARAKKCKNKRKLTVVRMPGESMPASPLGATVAGKEGSGIGGGLGGRQSRLAASGGVSSPTSLTRKSTRREKKSRISLEREIRHDDCRFADDFH